MKKSDSLEPDFPFLLILFFYYERIANIRVIFIFLLII